MLARVRVSGRYPARKAFLGFPGDSHRIKAKSPDPLLCTSYPVIGDSAAPSSCTHSISFAKKRLFVACLPMGCLIHDPPIAMEK